MSRNERDGAPAAVEAEEGLLSPELAFVVQFRTSPGTAAARFSGRVEHMASGRAERFTTDGELIAWMARELSAS